MSGGHCVLRATPRHLGNVCLSYGKSQDGGKQFDKQGAIYHNGQEKPTESWRYDSVSTVFKRLKKGYGIKGKCAALDITKFKVWVSAKERAPSGLKARPALPTVKNCRTAYSG